MHCSCIERFLKHLKSIRNHRSLHGWIGEFESFFEDKDTLSTRWCCLHRLFECWQECIIDQSSRAIAPDRSLVMLARNTDAHTEVLRTSIRQNCKCPQTSKKGFSSLENPLYFIFSESILSRYHEKRL